MTEWARGYEQVKYVQEVFSKKRKTNDEMSHIDQNTNDNEKVDFERRWSALRRGFKLAS